MADVLIIIPAYNEGSRIGRVLEAIHAQDRGWDVLVVNDGSTDDTAEAAASGGALIVNHPFNLGYGAALQTGYKFAFANGYASAVQMDGDGQHRPEQIDNLLAPIADDRADIVIGSRFLQGGGGYDIPLVRRIGMKLFGALATALSGRVLTDVTSGFSAVNRRVMEVFTSDYFPADYPDADVRLMMVRLGLRVTEVPSSMRSGPPAKSMHGGIGTIWYVIKMMLSMLIVWITDYKRAAKKEKSS